MLNWMQKNRKALIPTIWISTIAFVGAGFVGWGAYSFKADSSSSVAKVGNTPITIREFQQKYNNIYNYLNSLSGGTMTSEQADKMNLDMVALSQIIQDTLKLNFANDLGIGASNEDVAKYLVSMPEFQIAGTFDEEIYKNALARIGVKPKDFESDLRKSVILDKLSHALNLSVSKEEIQALASAYFMQDRVKIDIKTLNFDDVNATDEEIKTFWEKQKDSYKTKTNYELESYFVKLDQDIDEDKIKKYWEDNKNLYLNSDDTLKTFEEAKEDVLKNYKLDITKKDANKAYIALKNGDLKTNEKLNVKEDDLDFPVNEIIDKNVNEFLKPFEYKDGYLVVKIAQINPPKTMDFEQAYEYAKNDYKDEKAKIELEKLAKESLNSFDTNDKVKDLGYISRDSKITVDGLTEEEANYFINELFNTVGKQKGYITLNNKAVSYEITDQKLENPEKIAEYRESIKENISNLKNTELNQDLLNLLEKRYKIEQFYKGKSVE
ncbi:peptidylprolyl isomerase [Campylobacter ureolyticus]|uniref:peptidylprolyl isomerase n=1 Tax=Campylobacter ureolyticus TaxID=827 RepID=UPI0022B2D490|nr:SurA N-terminal domain-containing protein [Campylobacter ureolyticus]MCZ6168457.1 SurA N-terminal domain-containing protein [Campylobacter ureolyticus]